MHVPTAKVLAVLAGVGMTVCVLALRRYGSSVQVMQLFP